MPSSLQGAAPPVCLWGGLLASERLCTLHLLSLSGVHSGGLWCLQVGHPGSWPALQVRLSWGWLWSPSAAEQIKAGFSEQ